MFRIDRSMVNVSNVELLINGTELVEPAYKEEAALLERCRQAEEDYERYLKISEELVLKATQEAGKLMRQAEQDVLDIRAQGYKEGFEAGQAEAREQFLAQEQKDASAIRELLQNMGNSWEALFADVEQDFIELCLETVKKIINLAMEKDDTIFESLIKNALRHMKREGKITIRIGSREYERFFAEGSAVFVLGDEAVNAIMVNDPMLPDGGCIIESDAGTVNAGIDSQLKYLTLSFDKAGKISD